MITLIETSEFLKMTNFYCMMTFLALATINIQNKQFTLFLSRILIAITCFIDEILTVELALSNGVGSFCSFNKLSSQNSNPINVCTHDQW